jgi:hypothetical protein
MALVSGFGRGYWGEEGFGSVIPVKPTQVVNAWNEGAWGDVGFGGISRQPAAAVGQVGAARVKESALVNVTGLEATAELNGNVTIFTDQNIPQTGLEATGGVGSVSIAADAVVNPTGVEDTAEVGSVTVLEGSGATVRFDGWGRLAWGSGSWGVSVTPAAAVGEVNAVTATGDANVPETGLEATMPIKNQEDLNTFTGFGDAALSTAASKFGSASLLLDGNGDYIRADNNVFWGDADFTVEFWFRGGDVETGNYILFDNRISGSNGILITIASGFANLIINGTAYGIGGSVTNNTWHSVSFVRDGTNHSLFLDGVNVGSRTLSATDYSDRQFVLGASQTSLGYQAFDGNIDEFRASSIARYTTGYTPATSAFTADQYTPILLHFDGANGSTTFTNDGLLTVVFVTGGTGIDVPVTAPQMVGEVGQFDMTGDANVYPDGIAPNGEVGQVEAKGIARIFVSGLSATGEVTAPAVEGDANVSVTGVVTSGVVGSVLVWDNIDPDATVVWTEIAA